METYRNILHIFLIVFLLYLCQGRADKPCAAREIDDQSVVCVCNETYCDELTREAPASDKYVAYTSSKGGLRFNKTTGSLDSSSVDCCSTTLTVDSATQYQTIMGFGGAVTDAAGINWKNLSETLQAHMINSYFSSSGLKYSFIRVPIGGSDFSTHAYAYNELPENDSALSNYTLTSEDFNYKLPMIKAALQASGDWDVKILATCWSPPRWMKSNNKWAGFSHLLKDYYQTYANYHVKFLDKYEEQGVKVWGITTTNEPLNGVDGFASFNSLGWTASHMGTFIVENLGPAIRNSSHKDIKILTHDDQRLSLALWLEPMIKGNSEVLNYIDGIAVHYYTNFITPASVLTSVANKYPEKFLLATEACEGSFPWQSDVVIGSWDRAESYISDILEDINHSVTGWIDWNLCLNEKGGPNWAENYVDSPIIVYPEQGEFIKQPMFYALGHLSKFVPPGSTRLHVDEKKGLLESSIANNAFLTPNGTVVAVLYNKSGSSRKVAVRVGSKQASLELPEHSITTVELGSDAYSKDTEE